VGRRCTVEARRPTAATNPLTTKSTSKEQDMPDLDTARAWQDQIMVDTDGDKIGTIESIYVDDQTGQPEWALVNTGLFGARSTFVPLAQASAPGGQVQVPYQKQLVKDAPNMDPDGHLSEAEEQELWRHYGLDYGSTTGYADADRDATYGDRDIVGRDVSGPTTDDAMTRSEEELRVGTETRERGRARLRKYVVTEEQQVTVQREEVRLEREPITDANLDAATSGPAISEEEHEVTLREEEVVVDKRAVPKERVRLDTETVTEERQVSDEVRKERIEVEGDVDRR
jgi:uncharacterized protein (TIGR02271 family)